MENDNLKLKNVSKRYWLRGGLAGLVFSLAVISLSIIYFIFCFNDFESLVPSYCQSIDFLNIPGNIFLFVGGYISNILFYVFLGIFIGWIYGKIKSRKLNSLPTNY